MRPRREIPEDKKQLLVELRSRVKKADEHCKLIIMLLRSELNLSAIDIAKVMGWHVSSVRRIQSLFLKEGASAIIGHGKGGRRRYYFTFDQEKSFLSPFLKDTEKGGILIVNEIHKEYEKATGCKVAKSTVYRLLSRHGWRKIAPRPRHPKSDPVIQEEYKKTPRNYKK